MALDGLLLYKIQQELQTLLPAKINKIYMISSTELFFQLRCKEGKKNLLISCHSIYNRINITDRNYPTPEEPTNFVMFLRKHLDGATIFSISQKDYDRYLTFSIATRNELGDKILLFLSVELMGKYANVILYNEAGKIMDVLKRIPPFENNRRILQPGATFRLPDSQPEKRDPFSSPSLDPEIDLSRQLQGFSPLLSKEVLFRLHSGQSFSSIMEEIQDSHELYLTTIAEETQFHCIPLLHLNKKSRSYPIMEGLDILYYHKEEKDRIKQLTGDLFKLVRRELKHQRKKYPQLQAALEEALDCDRWREYGEYLQPYAAQVHKGDTTVTLERFDASGTITIPLDPRLDGLGNARKYFQKYNKGKKGQIHIRQQIELCQKEIDYFEGLEQQLEMASVEDAREIREELAKLGYCSAVTSRIRKKKKKEEQPKYTSLLLPNGLTLFFGKNNLQNEYITFKAAAKNDTWLHAKDYHGAHVVINTEHPDEETLRTAAMIAAWFSKGRYSSSVPINYCQIRQLKRVPGSKPGFVSLTHYRTLYIDPDEDTIMRLLEQAQSAK